LSIDNLSDVPLYAARPSRAVAPKRKAASWIAVFIVHLLLLSIMLFSQGFKNLVRHGGSHETVLDLTGSQEDAVPAPKVEIPQETIGVPPEINSAPVPVPPPPIETPLPQAEQGGSTQKGDLLGAIGRQIACSAGHFENLTEAERLHCQRMPWQGAQLPDGTLVLNRPEGLSRFVAPPKEEFRISGADEQRLRMERPNTGCPSALNMPCVNSIPGLNDK
jgi:hypothetical protein